MSEEGFPGSSASKHIVNPDILLNSVDRVFKAHLNSMQIAVMAKIRGLQRYYSEPDVDVLNAVITEMMDFSGSKNGINVKTYADVAKVRLRRSGGGAGCVLFSKLIFDPFNKSLGIF